MVSVCLSELGEPGVGVSEWMIMCDVCCVYIIFCARIREWRVNRVARSCCMFTVSLGSVIRGVGFGIWMVCIPGGSLT